MNLDSMMFIELVGFILSLFLGYFQLLNIERFGLTFYFRVRVMESAGVLVSVIFLSLLGNNILLKLLVGVVGVVTEGGALPQKLE